jgi:hypothetical protein
MYTSIKFFLDGFKPAIIFKNSDKEYNNSLRSKGYPYTKIIPGHIMFFQNKEAVVAFEKLATEGRKQNTGYVQNIAIADAIGIPPSAIEFFAAGGTQNWLIIDFYGLSFNTTEDRVTENLRWLKKTYKIPKDYPGGIEVIDKRETVYKLRLQDISNFKLLPHNGLFANKLSPIFQVTRMLEYVSATVYNGFDPIKAIREFNRNNKNNPQIDVYIADKHSDTFLTSQLKEFKEKYNK